MNIDDGDLKSLKKTSSVYSLSKKDVEFTPQQIRRIIAEDVSWSLEMLPKLSKLSLECIVKNVTCFSKKDLDSLSANDKYYLIENISLNLPWEMYSRVLADEERYWERMCRNKFRVSDVSHYDNSWRRMYMERILTSMIENFVPNAAGKFRSKQVDERDLDKEPQEKSTSDNLNEKISSTTAPISISNETTAPIVLNDSETLSNLQQDQSWGTMHKNLWKFIQLCGKFIYKLDIKQMLPPLEKVKSPYNFGENSFMNKTEDDSKTDVHSNDSADESVSSEDEVKIDHIDIEQILNKLDNLVDLSLEYRVKQCGMNFSWSFFKFTQGDCMKLAKALKCHKNIKCFKLSNSSVNDDQLRVLISHILDHASLEMLDFSHNEISDRGARAIGKILNNRGRLKEVILTDNEIGPAGAQAIGHAISKNNVLKKLDIKLNKLLDDGGLAIIRSLQKNKSLEYLNISGNNISEPTVGLLSEVIKENCTLKYINLSANKIGPDGGKMLRQGLEKNTSIVDIDIRLTECGQEVDFCVEQIINRNRKLPQNSGYNTYKFTMSV